MKHYQIFSDSSCDLSSNLLIENNIKTIPFYVTFDQTNYLKEIVDISLEDFYSKLINEDVFPKTSLPSVQDYINAFTESLEEDKDILCICITEKFSGSYQSAVNAKNILIDDYPSAKIYIVNSISATSAQGLLVLQAAFMQKDNYSIEDNVANLEELKNTSRIMFAPNTLEYLQKGGRIGKAASLAGTLLNLKPLIVLKEGELLPYCNVRGRKKSLDKCLEMVEEHFKEKGENYKDYDFCLITSRSEEEGRQLKIRLEELIKMPLSYPLLEIGVTIGTYTGPYSIAICFIKKYNTISKK